MKSNAVTAGPNDMRCTISPYNPDFRDGAFGDCLSCGDLTRNTSGPYFVPEYLSGSDYGSSSLVQVSNHRVFCDEFKSGQGIWWADLTGGYGSFGVLIAPDRIPADIAQEVEEWLGALYDYPLANEDDHSELENEAQGEAWESWASRDFRKELESQHDCDLSAVDGEALFSLFCDARDRANVYWENQSGSDVWIDVDRVAGKVTSAEVSSLPGYAANAA